MSDPRLDEEDERENREQGVQIVQDLAHNIARMTETQEGVLETQGHLSKQVKTLTSQVSMLNEMINALGPIMVEILELLRNIETVDDDEMEQKEQDIQKVEEGLMAAIRAMRRRR